jgi:hypothetical protein
MNAIETKSKPNEKNAPSNLVEGAQQSCESFEKCVEDNPGSAIMISAVIGLGVGVAIGLSLGSNHEPEPLGWFDSRTAEKMGHQFLAAMSRMVPESISNRFA